MVPLFQVVTSRPAPSCAGGGCLLATLDAKRRSPSCCRHAGLLCVPPWETRMIHPIKKVGLNDSRKSRGRASGGLGVKPPVMRTGGAVASRPRNRPLPKAPAAPAAFPFTARVSGCTGQDGLMTEARSIPRLWGRFRGNLGHQEGFWHGVCFPYLDNLGISAGS